MRSAPASPDESDAARVTDQTSSPATADLGALRRVLPFMWPKDDPAARRRVALSLGMLVLAKAATVATPIWLVIAYGAMRLMAAAFNQLRDAVFASVGQRALRRLGVQVFRHVHRLSLRFLVFSIGPLMLEMMLVAVIFYIALDVSFFYVIIGVIAAYVVFTFAVTERRIAIRRVMN
jgi:ATP-binding cassette subfamily B protein